MIIFLFFLLISLSIGGLIESIFIKGDKDADTESSVIQKRAR